MKTDALIAMLARGDPRVAPRAVERRLGATVAAAPRADADRRAGDARRAQGSRRRRAAADVLVEAGRSARRSRCSRSRRRADWRRPGRRAGAAAALGAALLALLWAVAAVDVASAPAASRPALVLGHSALPCVALIAVLSLPILAALFVALRSLAPTRLPAAGAAAGALAGGIAAAAYALHCNEMTLPFVAVWYVLGMAIPAGLGALLAPRWLRWA